jgi:hypothetical protein
MGVYGDANLVAAYLKSIGQTKLTLNVDGVETLLDLTNADDLQTFINTVNNAKDGLASFTFSGIVPDVDAVEMEELNDNSESDSSSFTKSSTKNIKDESERYHVINKQTD